MKKPQGRQDQSSLLCPVVLSRLSVVLVDLGLDVTNQTKQVGDDLALVTSDRSVHRLDLHLRVGLDLGCDVVLAAHVLRLVVLEGLLPLRLVALNLSLGLKVGISWYLKPSQTCLSHLLFCLLQPSVFPLPGFTHLDIFCSRQLLTKTSW